jgi:hypothetical protein
VGARKKAAQTFSFFRIGSENDNVTSEFEEVGTLLDLPSICKGKNVVVEWGGDLFPRP